jgi:hypothetical protein
VKFAFSFDVPAAISNASSEIPLMRSSSSVWSSPMVLLFTVAILSMHTVTARGGPFVPALGLPEPLQCPRSGYGLVERQVIIAWDYQFIRAVGDAAPLSDASRDGKPLVQFMEVTDMGASSNLMSER